jgi:DNA-binding transcriptional LysR family regulator
VLDWNDLRYLLEVARAGSTLAAAKALGTSQSTVHRHLAEFEERIGRALVKRHATGYRLTELGERLLPYAERAEAAMLAFERQLLASNKDLTGTVRVTFASTMADRLARSALIDGFLARYRGLQVEFVITDRVLDLSKGEADIAIRFGEPHDDALIGRKIAEVPWAVYASRSYVEHRGRPERPQDIEHHVVVGFDGEIAHYAAARWLRTVAPHARVAARSENWAGYMSAVKSGAGLGLLPIHHGDRERGLVRLIDTDPEVVSHFWLLMHRDMRRTPRVRAFFDFVVAEVKAFRTLLLRQGERPKSEGETSKLNSSLARDPM